MAIHCEISLSLSIAHNSKHSLEIIIYAYCKNVCHLNGFHDEVSSGLQLSNDLLESSGGNPSGRVLGIRLSNRFQEQTGLLHVIDVTWVGFIKDVVELIYK